MGKTSRQIVYKENENIQNTIKLTRCSDTAAQRQAYAALKKQRQDLKPLCGFRTLVEPEKEEKTQHGANREG